MQEFSKEQEIQELQYSFPHHYVPQYKNGFSSSIYSGFGINYVSTIEFLLEKLQEMKFDSICDVGCGDGRQTQEWAQAFPKKEVCGIDYSERAINLAKGFNPSLEFLQADIINDNIDRTFDVITLIEVFEHIPLDTAKAFAQSLTNLLNPNGVVLLTVPHENVPVSAKHFQHFSKESLTAYYTPNFEIEEVIFFENPKNWRNYIFKRLMKNKLFLLNNKTLLNAIYRSYKKHCFYSDEKNCARLFLKMRKK